MASLTRLFYHIVIIVDKREKAITEKNEEKLYNYIGGYFLNKKSHLEIINGIEDHLHILARIHPSFSLSDIVRDLKTSTNKFIKENNLFPKFKNWQSGYAAFSVDEKRMEGLVNYIKNQKEHHKVYNFQAELIKFLDDYNIEYNSEDPFDGRALRAQE